MFRTIDVNVSNNTNYYYKISVVSNLYKTKESLLTNAEFVFVHPQVSLASVQYKGNGFVSFKMTGKISNTVPSPQSFIVRTLDTNNQSGEL